jgi:hypothetical protein
MTATLPESISDIGSAKANSSKQHISMIQAYLPSEDKHPSHLAEEGN